MNIIFNATEACQDKGIINISTEVQEDCVSIVISNNGNSIPLEIQNKIFEPDFTTKTKGNGIGLAICKLQLQSIGGDINLLKSDEKETTFEIKIKTNN